jgi:hypothetical protein
VGKLLARVSVLVTTGTALAVPTLSCSGHEIPPSCRDVFEYSLAADVGSAPRVPCEIHLSAGGLTARYAVPKLPDPYLQPCFEQHTQPECSAQQHAGKGSV